MKKIGLLVLGLMLCSVTLYGEGSKDTRKKTTNTPQEPAPAQTEPRAVQKEPGLNQEKSAVPSTSKAEEPVHTAKLMVLPFTGISRAEGESIALILSNIRELQDAYTIIPGFFGTNRLSLDQEIIRSGLLDTETIAAIGRQQKADIVVTGHIKRLGERNLIIMNMVKVENFQQIAGTYREFQRIQEIPLLLSGMVKKMLELRLTTSEQPPTLGILPFTLPKNSGAAEDIEVLVQLLTIEIANTGTYTVIPRISGAEAAPLIAPQWVLTGKVMQIGESLNLALAQILNPDTQSMRSGGDLEYRVITDSLQLIPDLTRQLTGVYAAARAISIPENMVWISGGGFQMGSADGETDELPVHTVQVSGFFLGKTPVTQKEYEALMGSNPSRHKGENLPVENVSWYDAVEYCNKLSILEGLSPAYSGSNDHIVCNFTVNGYRLPTEAEWEYAARGGNRDSLRFDYAGGNNITPLGWFKDNSEGQSHEVGTKLPNSLGLYDMSGNVWEWCWDWYGPYQAGNQEDPTGPASGAERVNRGGSWNSGGVQARSTYRSLGNPRSRYRDLGFRILRSVF
ncbi:MAG: formylglycine-generating enzyme family protein [Treponema sp.]|jgi:formylglycine-generating enzyme required for sulfatase activity|nr:formylglycine-generating enzyme family protein [Treponema sp.]